MKKTIFFDVDNTLVCREKNVICDYTIKGINMCKNNGIDVAIATGRSLAMVKQENFCDMFNTIVSANGSLITVNNKVIYKKFMNGKYQIQNPTKYLLDYLSIQGVVLPDDTFRLGSVNKGEED